MQRFTDQPLGSAPHIAVLSSDKVGNFVVSTPLLRGLRAKYPGATMDLFGSDTNRDLEEACPYVDFRWSLYRAGSHDTLHDLRTIRDLRAEAAGRYDLAINLDGFNPLGPSAAGELNARYVVGEVAVPGSGTSVPAGDDPRHRLVLEPNWDDPSLVDRYPGVLSSNYIAEIFCSIAYVETDPFRLEVASRAPGFDVPPVLVHVTTTRTAKMWPLGRWEEVLAWCRQQALGVGLIGSAPDAQRANYNAGTGEERLLEAEHVGDLRGRTTLTELAGALQRARVLVTVDAGPLHVAAAVGCTTVAVFGNDADGIGASPRRLWAPRVPHVHVLDSAATCGECRARRYKNPDCVVPGHPCMEGVTVDRVIHTLAQALGLPNDLRPRPAPAVNR